MAIAVCESGQRFSVYAEDDRVMLAVGQHRLEEPIALGREEAEYLIVWIRRAAEKLERRFPRRFIPRY